MKKVSIIMLILGIGLLVFAIYHIVVGLIMWGVVKLLIGGTLLLLAFVRNRTALIIFGHTVIVVGCLLVTWGIYLPPPSPLTFVSVVFLRPLFWGFISILGGICANFHGFCNCMRK